LSVYGDAPVKDKQVAHSAEQLQQLWQRLRSSPDSDVLEGKF
jgi:hypothetical protein